MLGYHTYMTGKWDLGRALVEEHIPAGRGFESSFAQLTGTAHHLTTPDGSASGGIARADPLVFRENWDVVGTLPVDYFSSDLFTDKLIEYIDAHKGDGQPFFAYLSFSAPHFPLQVPEDWRDRFAGAYREGYDVIRGRRVARAKKLGILPAHIEMEDFRRSSEPWDTLDDSVRADFERRMEIYAAMVSNIDMQVGRVIEYLESIGERENTLILFMSDNGAAWSFPPSMGVGADNSLEKIGTRDSVTVYERGWAEAAMAPFREAKNSMAEGGTRTAAFIIHAGLERGGRSRARISYDAGCHADVTGCGPSQPPR